MLSNSSEYLVFSYNNLNGCPTSRIVRISVSFKQVHQFTEHAALYLLYICLCNVTKFFN